MSPIDKRRQRREKFIPKIAKVFAEFGYSRTTTAALARSCGIPENVLFRLWPSKKAMFIAAVNYVFDNSVRIWRGVIEKARPGANLLDVLLDYESQHIGEFGNFRIVFAGLSQSDDPEIRRALQSLYVHFYEFVAEMLLPEKKCAGGLSVDMAAWALVGIGTMANITNDLKLQNAAQRRELMKEIGGRLIKELRRKDD